MQAKPRLEENQNQIYYKVIHISKDFVSKFCFERVKKVKTTVKKQEDYLKEFYKLNKLLSKELHLGM